MHEISALIMDIRLLRSMQQFCEIVFQ